MVRRSKKRPAPKFWVRVGGRLRRMAEFSRLRLQPISGRRLGSAGLAYTEEVSVRPDPDLYPSPSSSHSGDTEVSFCLFLKEFFNHFHL